MSPTVQVLDNAVSGERKSINKSAGPLTFYTSGSGNPVLVLHSINASASVAEIAPVYEHLTQSHRVFAPDLPGFGFSDRSDRAYTIELYVNAIEDMLEHIEEQVGTAPVDAIGLSLACEFLARAAARHPHRFRSLTMITPTGFTRGSDKLRAPAGTTKHMPFFEKVLTLKLWREPLFNALVSPRSVRYFLRRTQGSPNIDETMARYADVSTHQPGASRAPFAFLSGILFSKDIRNVYESLNLPVFVPHGTRGDFADFRGGQWTVDRDNWQLLPYNGGALLHFERREQFMRDLDAFLLNGLPVNP